MLICQTGLIGYAQDEFLLEAEDGILSGWTVRANTSASGGSWVQAKNGGSGEWSIEITDDGLYSFDMFYATAKDGAQATILIDSITAAENVSVPKTGSNMISSAQTCVLLEECAIKKGTHTVKLSVSGADIGLDYITVNKTGDLGDNELKGSTRISAEKFISKNNAAVENSILKMPEGAEAVYNVKSSETAVYGISFDFSGDAQISIAVNDDILYEGAPKDSAMVYYEISSAVIPIKISVLSGELLLSAINFSYLDPKGTAVEAGYTKFEFEKCPDYSFESGKTMPASTSVGINKGDIFKFPIDLGEGGAGLYKLCMRYSVASGVSGITFESDSGEKIDANAVSTGSWSTFKTIELGTMNFPADQDTLTFTVSTSGGVTADYFTLERVDVTPEFSYMSAGGKTMAKNNKASRGADYINAVFSYYIDADSVNADSAVLLNGNAVIPCEYAVNDNVITFLLKETLDYDTEYTLKFSKDIKSTSDINLKDEQIISFSTGDASDDDGSSVIEITEFSGEYNAVSLSGTLYSSQNIGIAGRALTAEAILKNGNSVTLSGGETVSGENGTFAFDLALPSDTPSGSITIRISEKYAVSAEQAYNYVSEEFEENFLKQLKESADISAVRQLFYDNSEILKLDLDNDLKDFSDTDALFQKFMGKEFNSLNDVKKEYYRFVNYFDAENGIFAEDYATLENGNIENGKIKLSPDGYVTFNANINSLGYYIIKAIGESAGNSDYELNIGDTIVSSVTVKKGETNLGTYKLDAGKTTVTLKNISSGSSELSGIYICRVNTAGLTKGFGSISMDGSAFREGEGIGHYFKNGRNVTGASVGINQGDWFYYDIATAGTGTYKLTIKYSTPQTPTLIFTNPEGEKTEFEIESTGSWSAYTTKEIGTVKLNGDKTWLYLELASSQGISLQNLIFERIDTPLSFYAVYGNSKPIAQNETAPRGTDRLDVYFTACPSDVNSSLISLKSGTKTIPCEYELSDNIVSLKLKESLDYDSEYSILISGLTSNTGLSLTHSEEIAFKTGDESSDNGNDSPVISDYSAKYETLAVKGKIISSCKIPISGRKITINADGISLYDNTAISGDNGEFTLNCKIPSGTACGPVKLTAVSEYGDTQDFTVCYISKDKETEICAALKATQNAEQAKEFFNTYGSALGISAEDDIKNYTSESQNDFYEYFIGKSYSDTDSLLKAYKSAVIMFGINSAKNVREAENVFSNTDYLIEMGIDADMYSEIKTKKTVLHSALSSLEKITDLQKAVTEYNKLIKEYFLSEYSKTKLEAVTNSASVYTSQSIELKTGFQTAVTDIKKFVLTIKSDNGTILKNARSNGKLSLSTDNKTLTYEKDLNGEKVDIIESLYLKAPGSAGRYILSLSGTVTYDITAQSGKTYTVTDEIVPKSVTIIVSTASSGNSGSQSSTSGGGGGGSTVKPPKTDTDDKPDIKPDDSEYKFSDLDGMLWVQDSIYYLLKKGVISESETRLFNPNNNITREEFVKMLVTAFGLMDSTAEASFKDTAKDAWYYKFIASGEKYGIITGDTEGNFGVGKEITRQDMAVIINRILTKLGYAQDLEQKEEFSDCSEISDYAYDAVMSVKNKGIINGIGDNLFAPKAFATRAQAAKMIYGLMKICQ